MPRNYSELKSGGGTIPMLSPHAEKCGGRVPPVPHRSTPVLPMTFSYPLLSDPILAFKSPRVLSWPSPSVCHKMSEVCCKSPLLEVTMKMKDICIVSE